MTLDSNDHAVYQVNGENIADSLTLSITDRQPIHLEESPREPNSEMTVRLRMEDDTLGGRNLFLDTDGFQWAPEHAGLSPADGEGHAHLYVDGERAGRIYGPATYLGSLEPGRTT